jgi:hypothetical protein
MRNMRNVVSIVLLIIMLALGVESTAQGIHSKREGAYLLVEGKVSQITARMLVVDGQQYPISMFARVFMDTLNGRESSIQTMANIGKIDQAKLYILGGKVEKIVVIKNQ